MYACEHEKELPLHSAIQTYKDLDDNCLLLYIYIYTYIHMHVYPYLYIPYILTCASLCVRVGDEPNESFIFVLRFWGCHAGFLGELS